MFNKLDRVADEAATTAALQLGWPDALCLSARRPDDVARLRGALIDTFAAAMVEREVLVPYDQQARRADIFAACQVLEERYVDNGVIFRVRAPIGFV